MYFILVDHVLPVARFRRGIMLDAFTPGAATLTAMAAVRGATDALLATKLPKTTLEMRKVICDANVSRARRLCHQRAYIAASGGGGGASDKWPASDASAQDAPGCLAAAELSAVLADCDERDFPPLPSKGHCDLCGISVDISDTSAWRYVFCIYSSFSLSR